MKFGHALLLLTLLVGCAPREQALLPASQPAVVEKDVYVAVDGARLPLRQWIPAKRPRAVLVALHGFNDYSRAFTGLGEYMQRRGVATYAYDQRGFGGSPQRGIWAGQDNLLRDAEALLCWVRQRYPGVPVYLMGESMGGAVALLVAAQSEVSLQGVVFSAPAVAGREHIPPFVSTLLWAGAHVAPGYTMTGEGLQIQASDNIPMLREMGLDPLVIKATRLDAAYGLLHLMRAGYEARGAATMPGLLLYGLNDQLVPREPIQNLKAGYAGPMVHHTYEHGYHMLTRDVNGKKVIADIAQWMRGKPQQKPTKQR